MNSTKLSSKVASTSFYEQTKWSLWFFATIFLVYVARIFFMSESADPIEGFFNFAHHSANIFMLVCGIILVYAFMGQHVHQGVSRKDWYKGSAIASVGFALIVTLIPLVINGAQHLLQQFINLPFAFDTALSATTFTGSFGAAAAFFLNALIFYLTGWLIGIGYYRFGWIIGFVFIAVALAIFSINNFFWENGSYNTAVTWSLSQFPTNTSFLVAAVGSVILVALLFAAMHLLTKRTPIKM